MNSVAHLSPRVCALLFLLPLSAWAAPDFPKKETATPAPRAAGEGANTTPALVAPNGVVALRAQKASIGVPLFVAHEGGGFAALGVKLSATATADPKLASSELTCHMFAGPESVRAAAFIKQQVLKRHNGWPRGTQLDIACAEKIVAADLPAAAVATALLVDAMILGYDIDPGVVVLGTFNADGDLTPVIASGTRITAALRSGATRIVVPEKSTPQVADAMLAEGVAKFVATQIFEVTNFDEIPPLAVAQLDQKIQRGIGAFGRVQQLLGEAGDRAEAALGDDRVKEALRLVLIETPNHLSARLLLGHGAGQFQNFSIAGSIETVEIHAPNLVRGARCPTPAAVAGIPAERVPEEIAQLKALREKLDERAQPFLDALLRYGTAVQNWFAVPVRTPVQAAQFVGDLNTAARFVQAEWPKLIALRDSPGTR